MFSTWIHHYWRLASSKVLIFGVVLLRVRILFQKCIRGNVTRKGRYRGVIGQKIVYFQASPFFWSCVEKVAYLALFQLFYLCLIVIKQCILSIFRRYVCFFLCGSHLVYSGLFQVFYFHLLLFKQSIFSIFRLHRSFGLVGKKQRIWPCFSYFTCV